MFKNYKKELKEMTISRDYYKEMYEHYKELTETAIGELRFEKLQVEMLLQLLRDIEVFNDTLINQIIKNGIEKHNLDKLTHARILFFNK